MAKRSEAAARAGLQIACVWDAPHSGRATSRHLRLWSNLTNIRVRAVTTGRLDRPALYCHRKYMASVKAERLQIRVDPADKALLERAAAAAHLNVSAFVVQAAAARAEQVLAERPSIRLSPEAAAAFSEALEQPAGVNERLARALRRRRKFAWLH
jgi:uncharacterized protein (DUF1778 family)